ALAKKPELRWQTAADFADALMSATGPIPVAAAADLGALVVRYDVEADAPQVKTETVSDTEPSDRVRTETVEPPLDPTPLLAPTVPIARVAVSPTKRVRRVSIGALIFGVLVSSVGGAIGALSAMRPNKPAIEIAPLRMPLPVPAVEPSPLVRAA